MSQQPRFRKIIGYFVNENDPDSTPELFMLYVTSADQNTNNCNVIPTNEGAPIFIPPDARVFSVSRTGEKYFTTFNQLLENLENNDGNQGEEVPLQETNERSMDEVEQNIHIYLSESQKDPAQFKPTSDGGTQTYLEMPTNDPSPLESFFPNQTEQQNELATKERKTGLYIIGFITAILAIVLWLLSALYGFDINDYVLGAIQKFYDNVKSFLNLFFILKNQKRMCNFSRKFCWIYLHK